MSVEQKQDKKHENHPLERVGAIRVGDKHYETAATSPSFQERQSPSPRKTQPRVEKRGHPQINREDGQKQLAPNERITLFRYST